MMNSTLNHVTMNKRTNYRWVICSMLFLLQPLITWIVKYFHLLGKTSSLQSSTGQTPITEQ